LDRLLFCSAPPVILVSGWHLFLIMYLEVFQLENRQLSNLSDHTCIVRPEVDKMFSRAVNAQNFPHVYGWNEQFSDFVHISRMKWIIIGMNNDKYIVQIINVDEELFSSDFRIVMLQFASSTFHVLAAQDCLGFPATFGYPLFFFY
jgi:hypothetical protein